MADYLSPFASVLAQQPAAATPSEPSRCGSPVRVVGFDSSPTSVVSLRRSQSASESGATAVLDSAAATAEGGAPPASVSTPAAADPPMGFGRAPRSLPLDPRAASMARQSSLRTLLLQQEQLTQLHKRLSINTGRPHAGARACHSAGRGRARPDGAAAAALVHRIGDVPEDLAGTLPSAALHAPGAKGLATLPERGCTAAPPATTQQRRGRGAAGANLQGAPAAARRGSATGIDIPERLRRAGDQPHLSDDLIAAAAAAAAGSSAAPAAAATAPGSGPRSSSGGSSHSGSPSDGPSPPKQAGAAAATPPRGAVTREVLEAQAEAVAAAAQARVLQQALAQERQRADQLERQLQALLREFAEERAASAAAAAASAQQLAAALHAAGAQQPAPAAARQQQQQQQRLLEEQHAQLLAAQWAAAAAAQPAQPLPALPLQQAMPAVAVAERSVHGQWGEPPALDDLAAVLAAALDN